MEPDVTNASRSSQGDRESLNASIQVLVIDGVFIVPNASGGVGYLVGNGADAVVTGVWLNLVDGRSGPCPNRGLLPDGRSWWTKGERLSCAGDGVLAVGDVVVHVTLTRISLAPGVLVRGNVHRFGIIGCAGIQVCGEIANLDQHPVRDYVMGVASVIIRIRTGSW